MKNLKYYLSLMVLATLLASGQAFSMDNQNNADMRMEGMKMMGENAKMMMKNMEMLNENMKMIMDKTKVSDMTLMDNYDKINANLKKMSENMQKMEDMKMNYMNSKKDPKMTQEEMKK